MRWKYRYDQTSPPPEDLSQWAECLEISEALASFLWTRGLRDFEEMELFLNPSLRRLAPLEEWPGLIQAAEIVSAGLLAGQKVCIWGDYDVDGITATALLKDFIQRHGFGCEHHIPGRLTEGYGLNAAFIDKLAASGVDILITVDSGINDVASVAHARSLGMTVIITDHHLPGDQLPPANGIVNPRLADCPCPALAGVGVAFLLAAAVNVELHKAGKEKLDIRPLLDLVALGTLADVVDLNGQNRILVKNGLLQISSGSRVGIAALKSACNFSPTAFLGAGQVVFTLAPRINAAGRLGSSDIAVELLLTHDRRRASELADELSRLNAERRQEEERILEEAMNQAHFQARNGSMGLVLQSTGWHPGIIGIVASRVVEALHRPTVILGGMDTYLKGSGRSVSGVNIHHVFSRCADLLNSYGGHHMAAGLSLAPGNLDVFRKRFNELVTLELGKNPPEKICKIDGHLNFGQADFTFLKELEMLQPFGAGNAEPVFASPPVRIKYMRCKPGFVSLDLEDEISGVSLRATGWRQQANLTPAMKGKYVRIAFTPRIDRYNGAATVELRLKDWKPQEEDVHLDFPAPRPRAVLVFDAPE